ncbi:MAG TPA: DUF2127 domain-containing protein [Streptosporangiaceae bacterium]
MDWSLLACGRGGHVTYAPDEPAVRAQLSGQTPLGESWRCLRCGAFAPGPPGGHGPVSDAPQVRRGKEVRSALILRIFAVERFVRALVFGGAAFGVWRFSYSRLSLEQSFDHALPDVRRLYQDLGFSFQHSKLLGLVQDALKLNSHTLRYLALGLAAYAVIEIIEGAGLWLVKRWGEYFAMIATSAFLPYEIYDLVGKVSVLRMATFLVNLALVVYLVATKRLFGARGGRRAYEARLREDSIVEFAAAAAAAADVPGPAHAPVPVPASASTSAAAEADLPDYLGKERHQRSPGGPVADAGPGAGGPEASEGGGPDAEGGPEAPAEGGPDAEPEARGGAEGGPGPTGWPVAARPPRR